MLDAAIFLASSSAVRRAVGLQPTAFATAGGAPLGSGPAIVLSTPPASLLRAMIARIAQSRRMPGRLGNRRPSFR